MVAGELMTYSSFVCWLYVRYLAPKKQKFENNKFPNMTVMHYHRFLEYATFLCLLTSGIPLIDGSKKKK
jgi:hypothetical protein